MESVVIIGAGGFGREALDVIESINRVSGANGRRILGVVDDNPSATSLSRLSDRGYMHLGGLTEWLESGVESAFVVAIGNPSVRSRICQLIESKTSLEPLTVVHPSANLGSRVSLGRGAVVCSGVNISTNVRVGEHVHINPGAIIGHDTTLGDFVSVNPGAIVSGEVSVGRNSLLGAGAVVLQGLTVGVEATVGAGAVVTHDVAANIVVKGVPAR